jgi:IclR family KDG regulon transcriptional repressor
MTEIQSLARGLKILDLLAQEQDGISITELAVTLGVDKASASRLVSTLARYGYAEKDEKSRRYHLGLQVVSLSRTLLSRLPLRDSAEPFLRQLMERTGECAHLAVPAQGKVLYIDQVESPATLRVNAQVGTMNPAHCTALGKIFLAFGGLELPLSLDSYTPRTISDLHALRSHLDEVRSKGFAVDDEEFELGVRCIAVPVYDYNAKLIGSVGISGPSARMTQERLPDLIAAVRAVGKSISDRMIYTR